MKKEKLNYFDEFVKNSNCCLKSALILDDYIKNFDKSQSEEKENEVHELENEADQNLHDILNYLVKDFITPFDRDDIIALANAIDNLEDCIDEVVIDINIFNVTNIRTDISQFTELIVSACEKLKELLVKFKDTKKYDEMKSMVIEVNRIEEEGDSLYQTAISDLFKNEKDVIEVIKWKSLYGCLETCLDSAESVANEIESIIMKMS